MLIDLNIGYMNAKGHVKFYEQEVEQLMSNHNLNLLFLTETHLKPSSRVHLSLESVHVCRPFNPDRPGRHTDGVSVIKRNADHVGRISIVHEDLKYGQSIGIQVGQYQLFNLYLKPGLNRAKVEDTLNSLPIVDGVPTVILGDMNARRRLG